MVETGLWGIDSLKSLASDMAAQSERDRRVSPELITHLRASGLGACGLPVRSGGKGIEVSALLDAIATIAEGDGSAGWVTMIYSTSSVGSQYMSDESLTEVYKEGSSTLLAGVLAPRGTVEKAPGGYLLSGRWPFASGCVDADWINLGAMDTSGTAHSYLVPMGNVQIIDTWDVIGLRASASHDVAVRDSFVPAHRLVNLSAPTGSVEGLGQFPIYGLLAAGIGAVCLGIARGMMFELVELAAVKSPTGSKRRLGDRAAVQEAVARAEAQVAAAASYLKASVVGASKPATVAERARLRMAATHAVESSRAAVDLMYGLAGGSAIYAGSAMQRRFRDMHTATQHMMVGQPTWELAGRVLMDLDTDTTQL